MSDVAYRLVFDLADAGFKSWTFLAFGLIFVGLGILHFKYPNALPFRGPKWMEKHSRYYFLSFALLWTITSFMAVYVDYSAAKRAMASGKVQVVEGLVRKFHPMPASGHAQESFCVEEACFEYSDFGVTPGFNNTSSHGGPIREGLRVRITYVGNTIVRLEIAR